LNFNKCENVCYCTPTPTPSWLLKIIMINFL
jgi:hypothetical protein